MSIYRPRNPSRYFRPALHPSDAALIQRRKQELAELHRAQIKQDIARAKLKTKTSSPSESSATSA